MVSEVATSKRFQGPGYYHVYTVATGGGEFFRDDLDRQVLKYKDKLYDKRA